VVGLLAAGSLVSGYRIERALGQGGMGVVYLAQHQKTGQRVALKTVKVPRQDLLSSIRRETQTLSRLRHSGVVRRPDCPGSWCPRPWRCSASRSWQETARSTPQRALEEGRPALLYRGEIIEDIPLPVRGWLVETGRLPGERAGPGADGAAPEG
jgi:Protein kinase domain